MPWIFCETAYAGSKLPRDASSESPVAVQIADCLSEQQKLHSDY